MIRKTGGGALRRFLAMLLVLNALLSAASAEKMITLTFTGDCTLGGVESSRSADNAFDAFAEQKGYGWFFANLRDVFTADDCTVINLEGVLSDSTAGMNSARNVLFRGPSAFAGILTEGSVELAGLGNDHITDYQQTGLNATKDALSSAGIACAYGSEPWILEKNGIRIAFFSIDTQLVNTRGKAIRDRITAMKRDGEVSAVVALIHNGRDYDPRHSPTQEKIGQTFAAAGADLVIMNCGHAVQGVEIAENRSIFYCLGNFAYGGNREIRTNPYRGGRTVNSLYALAVQARLYFRNSGAYDGQQIVLLPLHSSGTDPANNYQPRRLTVAEAEAVRDAVQFDSDHVEIPAVEADEEGLARIVMPFLPPAEGEGQAGAAEDGMPEPPPSRPDRETRGR